MLLVEDGLPLLIEQLDAMPPRDRRAILAHLSSDERRRLSRLQRSLSAEPAQAPADDLQARYSADVADRISALREGREDGLTDATRDALRKLLGIAPSTRALQARTPSLMDSLSGALRRGRGGA